MTAQPKDIVEAARGFARRLSIVRAGDEDAALVDSLAAEITRLRALPLAAYPDYLAQGADPVPDAGKMVAASDADAQGAQADTSWREDADACWTRLGYPGLPASVFVDGYLNGRWAGHVAQRLLDAPRIATPPPRAQPEGRAEGAIPANAEALVAEAGEKIADARETLKAWGNAAGPEITRIITNLADLADGLASALAVHQARWHPSEEEIARVIDPEAWAAHDMHIKNAVFWERKGDPGRRAPTDRLLAGVCVAPSLTKARTILALIGEGEA